MTEDTLLLRQVHPVFCPNGELTSQAFWPFPKDEGNLSVYDGDLISAEDSFNHYVRSLGNQSCGAWAVTVREVKEVSLVPKPDPLPNFEAHALIQFGTGNDSTNRKLAKKLKLKALSRGCQFQPK